MITIRQAFTFIITITLLSISCRSTKQFVYFRGQGDSTIISQNFVPENLIKSNDILSILVSSQNPEASAIFNTSNNTNLAFSSSGGTVNQTPGYLVSRDGYIVLPMIGRIKADSLSKNELEDAITKAIIRKKILVDPVVNIRILTFKVTVLGEVEKPGVLSVPNEKISLLEALGLAGDLTINAQRDNILLIREETGKKITKRLNLNSSELFNSPYYYLKSNDVVYVEPNKVKVRNNSNAGIWVPIIFSALSFMIIAVQNKVF
jgi:polysaccharide export outer membrane protein